jgi:predicted DNA-binding transcriptional regulator AlpA
MLQTQTEKLLTAKAVGEMLSLSKRQIFRMKSAGLICSPVKVGQGAIRWRQSNIEKWIALGCPNRKTFEAVQQQGGEK